MANTLTRTQLEALRQYLEYEASLEEVRLRLRGTLKFYVDPHGIKKVQSDENSGAPAARSGVTCQHLEVILQQLQDEYISEYELVECAKVLLLNHNVTDRDEDLTANWMNFADLKVTDS